jgi:hypothetical protein
MIFFVALLDTTWALRLKLDLTTEAMQIASPWFRRSTDTMTPTSGAEHLN